MACPGPALVSVPLPLFSLAASNGSATVIETSNWRYSFHFVPGCADALVATKLHASRTQRSWSRDMTLPSLLLLLRRHLPLYGVDAFQLQRRHRLRRQIDDADVVIIRVGDVKVVAGDADAARFVEHLRLEPARRITQEGLAASLVGVDQLDLAVVGV